MPGVPVCQSEGLPTAICSSCSDFLRAILDSSLYMKSVPFHSHSIQLTVPRTHGSIFGPTLGTCPGGEYPGIARPETKADPAFSTACCKLRLFTQEIASLSTMPNPESSFVACAYQMLGIFMHFFVYLESFHIAHPSWPHNAMYAFLAQGFPSQSGSPWRNVKRNLSRGLNHSCSLV